MAEACRRNLSTLWQFPFGGCLAPGIRSYEGQKLVEMNMNDHGTMLILLVQGEIVCYIY